MPRSRNLRTPVGERLVVDHSIGEPELVDEGVVGRDRHVPESGRRHAGCINSEEPSSEIGSTAMIQLTGAKRRLVERLKRVETASAGELATEFGLTDTAVRQHLESLQTMGLGAQARWQRRRRGRPAARWQLTSAAGKPSPTGMLT
jgi:DNA-binding transcriptional ArsR family regulator